jgi:hypothetical protein
MGCRSILPANRRFNNVADALHGMAPTFHAGKINRNEKNEQKETEATERRYANAWKSPFPPFPSVE